ncbi:MAG TPA: copper homeostasis protein CutC [Propionibacteriaceae bacterium]|nr:copper homeostasis protein CutC [Propionibacteriaceae bacterium]
MAGLLEVVVLHAADAESAAEGGADRVELVGSMTHGGLSPEPGLVEAVRRATSVQLRVMLRLREGFGTDGAETTRMKGLASAYLDAGADGIVMGFLNGHSEIDLEVCTELAEDGGWPWTFHRAIDSALDVAKAWRDVRTLPGVDQVLTSGSARGLRYGLDDLIARARADRGIGSLVMAGGGLAPDHVPWLAQAGVRAFHIGSPARPGRSYKAYVDAGLVRSWRRLIDAEVRHPPGA